MDGDTISVERVINAPANAIFALLADAGKHASFDGSGTVDHTTAESIPLSLGTTFSMRMNGRPETLFVPYTMHNEV
ncbi:MAG: dimethyladenosine transferase, partial [Mycobacteriaceae bacterium]|nr:dimethyladenosine transferase [Mycobacteriaceae bacterium]